MKQLLYICQRDQILISSPSLDFLLRADILRAIYQRNPDLPNPFLTRDSDDPGWALTNFNLNLKNWGSSPMTESLLLELGIDSQKCTPENVRRWAWEVDLPWEYLDHGKDTCKTVLAVYLWEHNFPAPESVLRTEIRFNCYSVTMKVFRNINPDIYSDETIEEYLFRTGRYGDEPLNYQDLPTLIYLADSISNYTKDGIVYFKTKVGCINYVLSKQRDQNIKKWIQEVLVARWKNAYPYREQMIRTYLLRPVVSISCFYCGASTSQGKVQNYLTSRGEDSEIIDRILSFPPCRVEQEYLQLSSKLIYFQGYLELIYTILSRKYQSPFEIVNNIFVFNPIDVNLQTNRAELAEIVRNRTKKWSQLSGEAILRACGWLGFPYNKDFILHKIRESLEFPRFQFITDGRICSNPTTILEEVTSELSFLIAYGRFEGPLVCYSGEELEHAFIVTDRHVEFRRPERPESSFSRLEIENLNLEIGITDFSRFPDINLRPLREKIRTGLANNVSLEIYRREFQNLSEIDKEKFKGIFRNLFEAGMYQRRWCGSGPYHMKYAQTLSGTQSEISVAMTPSLNNVRDIRATLSPESLQLFQSLPSISDRNFNFMESPLDFLFNQTLEGNMCVASVSSIFIYSSYIYLEFLGETIPGFDIYEFEDQSTHRV